MNPTDLWKNFRLGEEVHISGTFIYNGLRRFHELSRLDIDDELFGEDVNYLAFAAYGRIVQLIC